MSNVIGELTQALICAYELTLLATIDGDTVTVEEDQWCASIRVHFPRATDDQCFGLSVSLASELAITGSLRCSVWQLAHAIEHELVKEEGTRH